MNTTDIGTVAALPPVPRRRSGLLAALLFVGCFCIYVAKPLTFDTADSVPTRIIPVMLLTEGRLAYDEYIPAFRRRYPHMQQELYFLMRTERGLVSFFPIAPGLLLTPFYAPFVWWKQRANPTREEWMDFADVAERRSAAVIASASVALLFLLLLRLGSTTGQALLLTLTFGFASNHFVTSSQQLFQHGYATLLSLSTLLLAVSDWAKKRNWALLLVGVLAGLATDCRPTSLVFAAAVCGWLAMMRRFAAIYAMTGVAITIAPVAIFNLDIYHNVFGGYQIHAPSRFPPLGKCEVLAAMLLSPAKGLLVFFPLSALCVVGLWLAIRRRAEQWQLHLAMAAYAVGQTMMIWWIRWDGDWYGGHCYGPRYLSDFQFALVMMLAPLLVQPRRVTLTVTFAITAVISLLMQIAGAYFVVGDPTFHPARVWALRDCPALLAIEPLRNLSTPAALPSGILRISAWQEPKEALAGHHRAVFAHAPSEIALAPPEGSKRITGLYGLFDNCYQDGGQCDGVEFVVDHVDAAGLRKTLFHRLLLPATEASDRGPQSLDLDVTGKDGEIVLMTRPGPAYDLAWDWSYWSEITFVK